MPLCVKPKGGQLTTSLRLFREGYLNRLVERNLIGISQRSVLMCVIKQETSLDDHLLRLVETEE